VSLPTLSLIAIPGMPIVQPGDDVAALITERAADAGLDWRDGDVVNVTSKIISKTEGRYVRLSEVVPDQEAERVAAQCGKDPREVALILRESAAVSRTAPGVLIVERRDGVVCANAGMDHSNIGTDDDMRLLLPEDANRSASQLRQRLETLTGVRLAVVISDSHGRAFRMGTVGVALGAAGLPSLLDLRGERDLFGGVLVATEVALADELAAAAGLLMGQRDEALPVVVVRGLTWPPDAPDKPASALVRPREQDLYR
jgi:coenzyme F420-0:L-glutamate ligase/coenzyme F420-1:gamma-L-glutamate ligase